MTEEEQDDFPELSLKMKRDDFRDRAKDMKRSSQFFLGLVFVALVAGIIVFIFARDLSEIGSQALDEKLEEVNEEILRYQAESDEYDSLNSIKQDMAVDQSQQPLRDSINHYVDSVLRHLPIGLRQKIKVEHFGYEDSIMYEFRLLSDDFIVSDTTSYSLGSSRLLFPVTIEDDLIDLINENPTPQLNGYIAEIDGKFELSDSRRTDSLNKYYELRDSVVNGIYVPIIDSLTIDRGALLSKIREIRLGLDKNPDEQLGVNQLVQINITRFGSILMILFFVRIIIPQYRYNVKMSKYYEGRADALELMLLQVSKEDLEDLSRIVTPDYNFGPEPATPYDKIIELVKLAKK